MSTRVIQLDIFQSGFRDDSDVPVALGTVEFYTADQAYSTAKNAYTTKDKGATLTSVTLDANGAYPTGLYFDGATVYDFRLRNAATTIIRNYTNVKIPQSTSNIKTVTGTTTATVDDDAIMANGTFTIDLYPVAGFVSPLVVKNIGTGTITVDGSGSELIDGSLTATIAPGVTREYWGTNGQWYAAATTSGTDFTDTTLTSGTNNSFDSAGGVTVVNVPDASNTVKGAIEIATDAEAVTGTAELLAINPLQLETGLRTTDTSFVSTEVFTGASPTTYADLDLSSVVGAVSRMVYLKVTNGTTLANFYFRTNGETLDTAYNSSASLGSGASAGSISSGNILYVLVKTDSAGVIEWETSAASTTTTIDVESYW